MTFDKGQWVEVDITQQEIGQIINIRRDSLGNDIYTVLLQDGTMYVARSEEMRFPQGASK